MKHLMTGVAMAAALAIAAPVWAQAPMTPGGNNPTSGSAGPFAPNPAPAAPPPSAAAPADAPAKAAAGRRTNTRKYMHHVAHHRRGMSGGISGGGNMAEQLNAQELQRLQAGAPPAPMARPMTPGGNNPTSGSAGPFAPPPPR